MGASFGVSLLFFLTLLLPATPQIYGQYGYPAYGQYYSGQSAVYSPYPYQYSNPYPPYYGYPGQSYVQNYPANYPTYSYPVQSYPSQIYQAGNYPVQQNYPQHAAIQPNNSHVDPYANLKVDIIDVEPKYFDYYKRFFKLEDNAYPIEVIDDNSNAGGHGGGGGGGVQQTQAQPYYTVKTESKHFNFTSIPKSVSTHDVKSKTYSFKRTFTLDPTNKENSVINLNFVNGVQVTDEPDVETRDLSETTLPPAVTEVTTNATTENDEPINILSWR